MNIHAVLFRSLVVVFLVFQTRSAMAQTDYTKIIRDVAKDLPAGAEKADSTARALLREFERDPLVNDSVIAKTCFLLAQANLYMGKRNIALNYYQKVLQSPHTASSPALADACWNNMATIYDRQFRYSEAAEAYQKSLKIAEQLGDSVEIVNTWINLGLLNQQMGNRDKAIDIYYKSYSYKVRQRDTSGMADVLINLANAYYPSNVAKAEQLLNEALALSRRINNTYGIVTTRINQATLESDRGNFRKSNEILQEVVALSSGSEMQESLGIAYRIMADNEIDANGNLDLGAEYLKNARRLAEETERTDLARLVKEVEIKLGVRTGNYNTFLQSLKDYIKFNDDYSQENARIINSEFQAIHEVKNFADLNQKLGQDVSKRNRQLLFSLLALLGAMIAVGIIAIQYYRLRQASKTMYWMNVEIANSIPLAATRNNVSSVSLNDDTGDETDVPLVNLYNILVSRIENEKLYLDPNLTLGDLCLKINRKQRYVSQAISEVGKTSFSSLINSFRVNEARRLLTSGDGFSVNEIIEKTGFGSRPAFHRNFKAATGFTPSEYQHWAKNLPPNEPEI